MTSHTNRRDLARQTAPIPCYKVEQLPAKYGGDELYDWLRTAVADGHATLKETLEIPPREARSWKVPAGCLWRIVCHVGPQVADMNCWSLDHPQQERFYSSKTRQIHATHLKRGDRLWSGFPYLRPMATIVEDTIDYGFDEDGAGVHDVIGSRCDPYTNWYMTQQDNNHCCHSNLTRQAVQADSLKECDVHDVLNVFMCTGFTKDTHQYFTKPSPVDVGDYIEFLAEIDLLVSASTCPQGDVSIACGDGDKEPTVYPLKVEVYELIDSDHLTSKGWKPSPINGYSGNHGM
ncbi:DUF1989 domain containing protein [Nitzschia inconspicua]|uniref:DUF1989 domain containing protein n=1 Tax=Nitzschia inconspicua TaxID=303405 RepID=A0A9K3PEP6_9STRA|nr:DUF1989 domain containing protein [Nitzschia inconspicua]